MAADHLPSRIRVTTSRGMPWQERHSANADQQELLLNSARWIQMLLGDCKEIQA